MKQQQIMIGASKGEVNFMKELKIVEEMSKLLGDDLLFIGRRGSHCLHLQDENSDEDLLVIAKGNFKPYEIKPDIQVMDQWQAETLFKDGVLTLLEAITSPILVTAEYKEIFSRLQGMLDDKEYVDSVRYHVFNAAKSQIKVFEKSKDEKAKAKAQAKVYLYYTLLMATHREELVNTYKYHRLPFEDFKKTYHRFKNAEEKSGSFVTVVKPYFEDKEYNQLYKDEYLYAQFLYNKAQMSG